MLKEVGGGVYDDEGDGEEPWRYEEPIYGEVPRIEALVASMVPWFGSDVWN